jgi:hypothetical protein
MFTMRRVEAYFNGEVRSCARVRPHILFMKILNELKRSGVLGWMNLSSLSVHSKHKFARSSNQTNIRERT